jgi:UDP-N-acetylmuramoylalanine--D-glutamate ligase
MLRAGGVPVEVAGNVGRAMTELPGLVAPDAWIACELSSFQLEDIDTLRCRVGVLLNLTPDHLDRHGTAEEYARCKLRIFENQQPEDVAVLNADDPWVRSLEVPGEGRREWVSKADRDMIDWEHATLRGDHNLENAVAAGAAARAIGVPAEAVNAALREFRPPLHRMQPVAHGGGVEFVDDSKATNPDATAKALTAYASGVHLILGGSLKGGGYGPLAEAVAAGPVDGVYLIGQAADVIAQALDEAGVAYERSGTLQIAVGAAAAAATPGDTVLLTPACASFDQFRDYADRGEQFARIAQEAARGL